MKRSGVMLFLGGLLVAAAAWAFWYFDIWNKLPSLTEPQAVFISGFLAVAVAIWAIYSQRAITRRQATLDHIAMLQADGNLTRHRVKFRELVKAPGGLAMWAALDKEGTAEYQSITTRLNEFELISIGIQRGCIDFELYARWYKTGTVREWRDAQAFITALRTRFDNQLIFHEFQEMVRWFQTDTEPPRRGRWSAFWF